MGASVDPVSGWGYVLGGVFMPVYPVVLSIETLFPLVKSQDVECGVGRILRAAVKLNKSVLRNFGMVLVSRIVLKQICKYANMQRYCSSTCILCT